MIYFVYRCYDIPMDIHLYSLWYPSKYITYVEMLIPGDDGRKVPRTPRRAATGNHGGLHHDFQSNFIKTILNISSRKLGLVLWLPRRKVQKHLWFLWFLWKFHLCQSNSLPMGSSWGEGCCAFAPVEARPYLRPMGWGWYLDDLE